MWNLGRSSSGAPILTTCKASGTKIKWKFIKVFVRGNPTVIGFLNNVFNCENRPEFLYSAKVENRALVLVKTLV